jgi:hypothetical protein
MPPVHFDVEHRQKGQGIVRHPSIADLFCVDWSWPRRETRLSRDSTANSLSIDPSRERDSHATFLNLSAARFEGVSLARDVVARMEKGVRYEWAFYFLKCLGFSKG